MDSNAKARLALLIKQLRGNATQKEFAKMIGVTYGAIQSWEDAEVTPGASNLTKIAKIAGFSLEELMSYLEGEEDKQIDDSINYLAVAQKVDSMSITELTYIYRAVSDRLVAIAESVGK
ncbi:Helix-turn-helix transcriptional regulator [Tumidithrix helvetica PCC 7403]|uniref:helix-turn-helix transcriptional regulator n=1 Tax=Tumidithrix helvetica TaxID=3457545 RepID=UPI003CAC37E6